MHPILKCLVSFSLAIGVTSSAIAGDDVSGNLASSASSAQNCPFIEQDYLSANPDVADAVRRRQYRSGYEHYSLQGYRENRVINYQCQGGGNPGGGNGGGYPGGGNGGGNGGGYPGGGNPGGGNGQRCQYIERDYININQDVADAVRRGIYRSGYEHYQATGYGENRVINANCHNRGPFRCQFSEREYLELNQDVAEFVRQRRIYSGYYHYLAWGYHERRPVSRTCDEWGYSRRGY